MRHPPVILAADGVATRDASGDYPRPTREEGGEAFHEDMDTFDTFPLIVAPLVGLVILLVVAVANLV